MRCPGFLCGSLHTKVVKTFKRSLFIRRIRVCAKCGIRFATEERKSERYPVRAYTGAVYACSQATRFGPPYNNKNKKGGSDGRKKRNA